MAWTSVQMETLIPLALSLLALGGAVLILFKAPRRLPTLLVCGSFVVLSAKEAGEFYFLYTFRDWAAVCPLIFEVSFTALWVSGLTLSFQSEPKSFNRMIMVCWFLLIAAGILTAATLVRPQWFFYKRAEMNNMLLLGEWGRLHAFYVLCASVFLLGRLERLFRESSGTQRWLIKYPILGAFVVSGVMIWQAGLRLSYRTVNLTHIPLYSAITFTGLALFLFFVIRHKLFDLRVFISRYVVYRSVTLGLIGLYLLGLGIVGLGVQYLGVSIPFIIQWLFIFITALFLVILLLSHKLRQNVKHFISTHFYENKYDYRHEWVNFTGLLSKAAGRHDVISSLETVIRESMFVKTVTIWLGDDKEGYKLVVGGDIYEPGARADENLITYLKKQHYFLRAASEVDFNEELRHLLKASASFFDRFGISLAAPISCAGEFFGFVALGDEVVNTSFNQDDVDLITALSSQAAVSLMTIKLAVDLSEARELSLINKVNAFILHDLKNAASLLSLLNQSAPQHIGNPEYQEDLLEAVENAHARIQKVMKRLQFAAFSDEKEFELLSLSREVESFCRSMDSQWKDVTVTYETHGTGQMKGSLEWTRNILENLLLNAKEAVDNNGIITIVVSEEKNKLLLRVTDNGVGINRKFMEEKLFKPFQTNKKQGLGIGLWQVKHHVESMGGSIEVNSSEGKGTSFFITFPLAHTSN